MSPGKRKFLDEAAKGYEKDKKDRSAREFSSRVVKDLYPSIAAGQVASLKAAGVIDASQEKKVLKEFVVTQKAAFRKHSKKSKHKHKSKHHSKSKKKKRRRSYSSASSSSSSDTSSSSSSSSSSSTSTSSDSSPSPRLAPGLCS